MFLESMLALRLLSGDDGLGDYTAGHSGRGDVMRPEETPGGLALTDQELVEQMCGWADALRAVAERRRFRVRASRPGPDTPDDVVDDDADIRETLAELLEDEGYPVLAASNGAEALELLRDVAPCLILLDLSMPIMSGQQFRAQQVGDPTIAAIPTVVMTAADRMLEKTAEMRVAERLAKPLKMEKLFEIVGRFCGDGA